MANLWRRRTDAILKTCLVLLSLSSLSLATLHIPAVPPAVAVEHDGVLYLHSNYDNEILGHEHSGAAHGPYSKGFAVTPGVLSHEYDAHGFDYRREFSPKLATIYNKYLNRPTGDFSDQCSSGTGHDDDWLGGHEPEVAVDASDFESAFLKAGRQIEAYERSNQEYLATDPRGLNFSAYVYVATLHAKYNELLTKQIKLKKCLSRKQIALQLPGNPIPANPWKKKKYCELQSRTTLTTVCDPHEPYRRLDGKCNNPLHTNLGSSFHCHRRLLPPDYSDGIYDLRVGVDGRPLPSPRLVTQIMMPDLDLNDPSLSALHFAWGQFLVHDTFRTIQHLGLAIDCCRQINPPAPPRPGQPPIHPFMDVNRGVLKNSPPVPHPECIPIVNFPPNKATEVFQQICINTVRSINCNTCGLGPRNQMNVATQIIDLSNVYGGNLLNNSEQLRSFIGGQMLLQIGDSGQTLLPVANLPSDTDTLDLTPCNPPLKNPNGVGCFRTGDGIRGNQNPFIASIQTIMARRHNQHAVGLAAANPHWNDEQLFQETRRLLIAEVQKIHYTEYVSLILGERLMKYFHLNVRSHGFTKYNPHVEPSTIHAAGVGALRIGHSQTRSRYRIIGDHYGRTSFFLRERFFNMIDVWAGQITPIIRGIMADPSKNVDPYGVIDLKDFLFFNPRRPQVVDLLSININRGRDHGVPAYIYNLQYCTGAEIKSWKDLERFIPATKVKTLRKVYRHFKDIDLFLGGLLEYHLKGARVGPTYACLIGIQFYHWKYGDRFYFEHGGEAGSFSADQLTEIRSKVSLANLLCKGTELEMIPVRPLEETGPHNPKISCAGLPEIDYFLFRDEGYKKRK